MDDLQDRVEKFQRLALPGQPMGMHMGTNYLVNDLWREVERLRSLCESLCDDNERLIRSQMRQPSPQANAEASDG